MTPEEKQLLHRDLSARLPYGVKGLAYIVGDPCLTNTNIVGIINESIVTDYESPMLDLIDFNSKDIIIKPYLRPMDDMTEEEKEEFSNIVFESQDIEGISASTYVSDWLMSKYFDVRGLIPKGLALPAPEGMYANIS